MQCKWVYRNKVASHGSDINYNAIFVSKLFSQFQGMDYMETCAPVAKMDSIRPVLAIVASKHCELHHMDVKISFIHAEIHEDICMHQHEGFQEDPSLVGRLKKSLYGLKQALRACLYFFMWYIYLFLDIVILH